MKLYHLLSNKGNQVTQYPYDIIKQGNLESGQHLYL